MQEPPQQIECIGDLVAIRWPDGREDYLPMPRLRAWSPSAEQAGERDLMGRQYGGASGQQDFTGVSVTGWNRVGSYAVQFIFSDGHRTGIYAFDYLRQLGERAREENT